MDRETFKQEIMETEETFLRKVDVKERLPERGKRYYVLYQDIKYTAFYTIASRWIIEEEEIQIFPSHWYEEVKLSELRGEKRTELFEPQICSLCKIRIDSIPKISVTPPSEEVEKEEFEVSVAGVTEDSPIQKLLDWIDKNKDGLHGYTLGVIKSIAESYDTPSKLSVTGNKSGKTEEDVYQNYMSFARKVANIFYYAGRNKKYMDIPNDVAQMFSDGDFDEYIKSTPVNTLDKEQELTKFLKWVDEKTSFFEDKDVTISQVVEEYLRLCTGGEKNDRKR